VDLTLQTAIADYLLARRTWVPAADICDRFQIRQRILRAYKGIPGLLTEIAISGDKGYRHIATCTESEWQEYYGRNRSHGLEELRSLRRKRDARRRLQRTIRRPPLLLERHTPQTLMPSIINP
jgi:hypothetical protein